jgi:hypothetical protein
MPKRLHYAEFNASMFHTSRRTNSTACSSRKGELPNRVRSQIARTSTVPDVAALCIRSADLNGMEALGQAKNQKHPAMNVPRTPHVRLNWGTSTPGVVRATWSIRCGRNQCWVSRGFILAKAGTARTPTSRRQMIGPSSWVMYIASCDGRERDDLSRRANSTECVGSARRPHQVPESQSNVDALLKSIISKRIL